LWYWNEVYVAGPARDQLAKDGHLPDPHAFPVEFEDYGMKR
jgi:hypothetical protein